MPDPKPQAFGTCRSCFGRVEMGRYRRVAAHATRIFGLRCPGSGESPLPGSVSADRRENVNA